MIGGISQKMLTQTLRSLERDGLVARTVYPIVPPRVEYALTPLDATLLRPLGAICQWAEEHLPEVATARRAHSERTAEVHGAPRQPDGDSHGRPPQGRHRVRGRVLNAPAVHATWVPERTFFCARCGEWATHMTRRGGAECDLVTSSSRPSSAH